MTDDNVSTLPQPGLILDLDAEQRPSGAVKPPFIAKVGGRAIRFSDPEELDWRDVAQVEVPADFFHVALSKDDRRFLLDLEMPTWKFNKLLQSYYDYYELEDKVAAARRRANMGSLGR